MMKAAFTPAYGPAGVLAIREVPSPEVKDGEVLVEVRASAVTAGDLRLRAGDFPSITSVPGRLALGVFGPRKPIQGTMFAGRVVAVGKAVTRFAVGDDVFGEAMSGAYAQYLTMPEGGAIGAMPAGIGYDEAASLPYGALTALRFLRDLGEVKPGDDVLVIGASGGVGRFAVEIAKHLGADVTAVCSRRAFDLVRSLGADHLVDRETEDFTKNGRRYDVIFDTAGVSSFSDARPSLTEQGRYLTLFISVGVLLHVAITSMTSGPRAKFGIAMADQKEMEELRGLVETGAIRPLVARRFPLDRIAEAHVAAESRRDYGAIIVTVEPATALQA